MATHIGPGSTIRGPSAKPGESEILRAAPSDEPAACSPRCRRNLDESRGLTPSWQCDLQSDSPDTIEWVGWFRAMLAVLVVLCLGLAAWIWIDILWMSP